MSNRPVLLGAAFAVLIGGAYSGALLWTTPSEAQETCQTKCGQSNATCMAGSCRCSLGDNGFCAPPYPSALPLIAPLICSAPNYRQVCGEAKLCCGAGLGMCVDGNHPMCVR